MSRFLSGRSKIFWVAIATLLVTISMCSAEMSVLISAQPGTILIGTDSGKFKAKGPSDLNTTIIEEAGGLAMYPNILGGVGWDANKWNVDVEGGIGILLTDRFRDPFLDLAASANYKFRKNVSIGPRIGLAYFMDPDWSGDAQLDFSDHASSYFLGLQTKVGYDVLFVFSVNYYWIDPFEVHAVPGSGWEISKDEIDFSGLGLQFGMQGRF